MAGATADDAPPDGDLDILLQNFFTSSAIEGERLNVASVRAGPALGSRLTRAPRRVTQRGTD